MAGEDWTSGPTGVTGQKGAQGETGVQAPPGKKEELSLMPFKNWKEA